MSAFETLEECFRHLDHLVERFPSSPSPEPLSTPSTPNTNGSFTELERIWEEGSNPSSDTARVRIELGMGPWLIWVKCACVALNAMGYFISLHFVMIVQQCCADSANMSEFSLG